MFCCERNTSWAAGVLNMIVHNYPNIYILRENEKADFGVWTSEASKDSYGQSLITELWREGLYWLDDFVICPPLSNGALDGMDAASMPRIKPDERRMEIKKALYNQMQRAYLTGVDRKIDNQPVHKGWSAKVTGDSDDELLCIAFVTDVINQASQGKLGMRDFKRAGRKGAGG